MIPAPKCKMKQDTRMNTLVEHKCLISLNYIQPGSTNICSCEYFAAVLIIYPDIRCFAAQLWRSLLIPSSCGESAHVCRFSQRPSHWASALRILSYQLWLDHNGRIDTITADMWDQLWSRRISATDGDVQPQSKGSLMFICQNLKCIDDYLQVSSCIFDFMESLNNLIILCSWKLLSNK